MDNQEDAKVTPPEPEQQVEAIAADPVPAEEQTNKQGDESAVGEAKNEEQRADPGNRGNGIGGLPQKRKVRELRYIDKDNIIEKDESNATAARKDDGFGVGGLMGRQQGRADRFDRNDRSGRAGGLDYYRDRFDQFQNSYNRKKHGHLQNMAGNLMQDGANQRQNNKMREFVHSQLQKKMLQDRSADNLRKNLDALNMPTQIEDYFADKVQLYEQMRGLETELNDFMQ